ncbi:VacJ family lipoprotein [Massilia arenosa]|uniref:VacJ family lipoprotein n=1 Tax=Zemynaea arenosa TaxID=2561931 RepID=A0A4Y9RR98_9BURK|nr:VacJ family lipoprotein [Massilia arenosa]TFW10801.1 VacJ family lipoprotein [Massilia arenosa]
MTFSQPSGWRRSAYALALAAALSGCASTPAANPRDPFEKFNRAMFSFNDAVDRAALKPAATAYKNVLPQFVQTGVNNFFGNLADIWTGANNLLQGKGKDGTSDLARVALNSTVGLLGFVDVASGAGLQKHNEDFGQTLGAWGVPAGPYVMLPIFGPSTVRDTVVLPIDLEADPWNHKEPIRWRNTGIVLRAVDERASILDASNLMEEAALDRYEFIRDGFLQRRDSKIYDTDKLRARRKDKPAPDEDAPPPNYEEEDKAAAPADAAAKDAAAPAAAPAPAADAKPAAEAKPAADAPAVPAPVPAPAAQPQAPPTGPAQQDPAPKQPDTNSAPSTQK